MLVAPEVSLELTADEEIKAEADISDNGDIDDECKDVYFLVHCLLKIFYKIDFRQMYFQRKF